MHFSRFCLASSVSAAGRSQASDIVLFVARFTRPANDLVGEDMHFRYCVDTDIKLLPEFVNYLAKTFVERGDYEYALEKTCADIGTISEDGDAWVDKHSGYVIKYVGFDTDEGYDEAGFKVKSREMLASDLGNVFIQATDDPVSEPGEKGKKEETSQGDTPSVTNNTPPLEPAHKANPPTGSS